MQDSPETRAIRQRMEEVRGDLDTGFRGIVDDARDLGDWTYYLKNYPWVILGTALVAGYFIAPRLGFRGKPEATASESASSALASQAPLTPSLPKHDFSGTVMAIVGNLAMRGLTAIVVQQADRFFASRTAHSDQDGHR